MEFIDCVERDRATRSFTDEEVSDDDIRSLINIARSSGSGKNRQPWSFIAIRDRDRLDELASLGKYTTPLKRAPAGIILLVDDRDDDGIDPAVFDCGRAFQNLKLAATDMGLGSVPQGIDRDGAAELLNVPETKRVLIALAIGHPRETPEDTIEGEDKEQVLHSMGRKPLEEILDWETC